MKKVFYTAPAVVICLIYGMLALLAGGFASLQLRAWTMILLPLASAILLCKGKWWGCVPGILLGGLLLFLGITGQNQVLSLLGVIVCVYYFVMGILCIRDAKKQA